MHEEISLFISEIRNKIPYLINNLYQEESNYIKFTLEGDKINCKNNKSLIQTILFIKIITIINQKELSNQLDKNRIIERILSLKNGKNEIAEPSIRRIAYLNKIKHAIVNKTFKGIFNNNEVIAMTRSSYNTLTLLGHKPSEVFRPIDFSSQNIRNYIEKLHWINPWSAGSHFNHLIFFLKLNHLSGIISNDNFNKYINLSLNCLDKYFDNESSSWRNHKNLNQNIAINGTMKICMALSLIDKLTYFKKPENIIENSLQLETGYHACDYFNNLYVMYSLNKISCYKKRDMQEKVCKIFQIIKKFYIKKQGGFSFYKHRSQTHYYGLNITRGNNEADLHGTAMHLWGIALIAEILGIKSRLKPLIT